MTGEFHFSPRPNRAQEIRWRSWGQDAFAEAKAEKKLVLLSISGVWCHWCHVMDETSYSDPRVIELLNSRYIPIRVDTDHRPDINARYNLGGWPTTAVLTPEGSLLTGGTYIPPEEMRSLLQRASKIFANDPTAFQQQDPPQRTPSSRQDESLTLDLYDDAAEAIRRAFDRRYGGFGRAPKFPMVEALELALVLFHSACREEDLEMVTKSLRGMSGGGMYDAVEGGFFRYSTTRDWMIPHYEKMLEDNGALLGILAQTYAVTGDEYFLDVARDVLRFLKNTLYDPERQCWAGSQDADEEYYMLALPERRRRESPYIDRHIYVDLNAQLARSLCLVAWITGERQWQDLALATLNVLWQKGYHPGQGMAHVVGMGGSEFLVGRLDDQVAMGRACLAAFQSTGDETWLERSRELIGLCRQRLHAPGGGFYDIPPEPEAPGALAVPLLDMQSNARAARWLVANAALDGAADDREEAVITVKAVLSDGREAGIHAAGLALAVYECIAPTITVTVVGPNDAKTQGLHYDALSIYRPGKVVRLLEEGRHNEQLREMEYTVLEQPQAYVCVGRRCLPPVTRIDRLRSLLQGRSGAAITASHTKQVAQVEP